MLSIQNIGDVQMKWQSSKQNSTPDNFVDLGLLNQNAETLGREENSRKGSGFSKFMLSQKSGNSRISSSPGTSAQCRGMSSSPENITQKYLKWQQRTDILNPEPSSYLKFHDRTQVCNQGYIYIFHFTYSFFGEKNEK